VIDRKTALLSAALIVLTLIMAIWRIATLEHWTIAVRNGAPVPSLRLLIIPACGAFVVSLLYWKRPSIDAAKLEPWRKWGAFVSISYVVVCLLLQAGLIIKSLEPDLPLDLSTISRTAGVVVSILLLLGFNQIPKLPYFERRFAPGGELGPIYGPRYLRIQSRIMLVFSIAMIAFFLAPGMAWRAILFIAAPFLIVWSIAWRLHLSRKWKRQQLAERGLA
jgi:hypothetical protein